MVFIMILMIVKGRRCSIIDQLYVRGIRGQKTKGAAREPMILIASFELSTSIGKFGIRTQGELGGASKRITQGVGQYRYGLHLYAILPILMARLKTL